MLQINNLIFNKVFIIMLKNFIDNRLARQHKLSQYKFSKQTYDDIYIYFVIKTVNSI